MLSFYRRTLDIVLRHQRDHARRVLRHHGADRGHGDPDPEGLLPDPGHRHDLGLRRGGAGHLARGDDAADAQARRRDPARSRRRRLRLVQPAAPAAPRPPTPAAVFIVLKPRDERELTSSQIIDRLRPQLAKVEGANAVPAADAGHHRRRPHRPRQLPVHAAGRQHRRAERVVAEDAREDADAAAARRRLERSAGECAAAQDHHQPRPGLALRHFAAADRRHAQRRLRPAPDHAVFHPAQDLFRHPRNPARAAERPVHARPPLREIAADRRRRAAVVAGRCRLQQGRPALGLAPGPVPGGDADVQPAARRRARRGGRRHQRGGARDRHAVVDHRRPSRATRRRSRPRCRASRR